MFIRRMVVRTRQKKGRSSRVARIPRVQVGWKECGVRLLLSLLFLGIFYYFFIRPYAYRWRYVPGQEGYGVYVPSGYAVYGIDISRYQKDIDWVQLVDNQDSKYPIKFVFIKATEGETFRDVKFQENFHNARRYGFIRGAYHFYLPAVPPEDQARNFIQAVRLLPGDLPPVLDVERRGHLTGEELSGCVKSWLHIVEAHYGVKPIIYASWKFKENYLNDAQFDEYPFWIAHYYVDSVRYRGKWNFWQYTDIATIPGIDGHVDMNIFNGTIEQLSDLTLR